MAKIEDLHAKLVSIYIELLDNGCEDPRVLKEVREFLNDNDITSRNLLEDLEDSEVIELDMTDIKEYMNG